jgi:hypothetical protein
VLQGGDCCTRTVWRDVVWLVETSLNSYDVNVCVSVWVTRHLHSSASQTFSACKSSVGFADSRQQLHVCYVQPMQPGRFWLVPELAYTTNGLTHI